MSSRSQQPQVSLKERIAALQQRSTSSSTSASKPAVAPKTDGAGDVHSRIASLEGKGVVPKPRGNFGLAALPTTEGAVKKRGELYGNRIAAPMRSRGPSGTIQRQNTGSSQPPLSPGSKRRSLYGSDFDATSEYGASRPGSALGGPNHELPDVPLISPTHTGSALSPMHTGSALSPMNTGSALSPMHTGGSSLMDFSSGRPKEIQRATDFAIALERARKTERRNSGIYHSLETYPSPSATLPDPITTNQDFLADSGPLVPDDYTEAVNKEDDEPVTDVSQVPAPMAMEAAAREEETAENDSEITLASVREEEGDEISCVHDNSLQPQHETSTPQNELITTPDARVEHSFEYEADAEFTVQLAQDHLVNEGLVSPELTEKSNLGSPSTLGNMHAEPATQATTTTEIIVSQEEASDNKIPESEPVVSSPPPRIELPVNPRDPESLSVNRYTRPVTMFEGSQSPLAVSLDDQPVTSHKASRSISNGSRSAPSQSSVFTAVVHGKVTKVPAASSKPIPSTPVITRVRQPTKLEPPASPGYGELSILLQNAALLEERLSGGDIPSDAPEPQAREVVPDTPNPEAEPKKSSETITDDKSKSQRKLSIRQALSRKASSKGDEDSNRNYHSLALPTIHADIQTPTETNASSNPPPSSKSPSRYLSSLRRIASGSRTSAMHGAYPRHSVSTSSEISSEDSMIVVTPSDRSPDSADQEGFGRTGVAWPSMSPKKNISRASSMAEKLWPRSRSKSNTSAFSVSDSEGNLSTSYYNNILPELPGERLDLSFDIPNSSANETKIIIPPARTQSLHASHTSHFLNVRDNDLPPLPPPPATKSPVTPVRPASWMSVTSTNSSLASPLFDKDLFDMFPAVPEVEPSEPVRYTRGATNTLPKVRTSAERRRYG